MTTSRSKAIGSAAERQVAKLLGGERVGMDGGPVDVVLGDYCALQVKNVRTLPSLNAVRSYIEAMPPDRLRAAVVIERAGSGRRGVRLICFDLDEWVAWHGGMSDES
ncbi:MAG TPA: hypothetical protein VMW94_02390 [Actinomycetes bacterium]|nr:hypothetical protein [Actinomycetes bacterium]